MKELEGLLKHEGTNALHGTLFYAEPSWYTVGAPLMHDANFNSVPAGSGDLIPVIGFFCQRCEEFFGDLSSAEGHKHTNTHQVNTLNTV